MTILFIIDDAPKGCYKDMKNNGTMADVSAVAFLYTGLLNFNTWLLFVQYPCCFGVELTIKTDTALYFKQEFKLTIETSAAIESIFGWMNIFARGCGGFASDKMNYMMGIKGHLIWQTICLLIEGGMVLIFANSKILSAPIFFIVVFSTFVWAA